MNRSMQLAFNDDQQLAFNDDWGQPCSHAIHAIIVL